MRKGALLLLVAACQADPDVRPQWRVTLRTDAPVPFVADRALVEVRDASGALACPDCRRILDASTASLWPISFGVTASDAPLSVRVRLSRATAIGSSGAPDPLNAIDASAVLRGPPGPTTMSLAMQCYGVAASADAACDPKTGALAPIADAEAGEGDPTMMPGSWALATTPSCDGDAPSGMACVPGGLFYMGDSAAIFVGVERLVHLSAYFADIDEMSVGHARALIAAGSLAEPTLRSADVDCTYLGKDIDANDDQPLNCLTRSLAASLCAAEGKRLPTDAELGYVSTNGASGTTFPWGNDDDICSYAAVARDAVTDGSCIAGMGRAGVDSKPDAVNAPTRDVTVSPSGFRHLGGNMSEWVVDTYADLVDPCWTREHPVLDNPVCSDAGDAMTRGGYWNGFRFFANARFRTAIAASAHSPSVGVRCVKDAHH